MSLLNVEEVHRGDKAPEEDQEVVQSAKDEQDLMRRVDPKHIHVQVLYRPDEPIHEVTQDSLHTWIDAGMRYTRMRDPFGGWINSTRNWQTRLTLQRTQARYLMLIDADVGVTWPVPMLLARHDKPVISGVVPCFNPDRGGMFLNIAVKDRSGLARFPSLGVTRVVPSKGLVQVHNAGTGCLLVRRDVLEKLWAMYEEDEDFGQPFELPLREIRKAGETGTVPRGEDICFTDRCRKAGFDIWADFEARCIHRKRMDLQWPEHATQDMDIETWSVSAFDQHVRCA